MMIAIDELTRFAQKIAQGDGSGHGFDHIQRVVTNAQNLLQATPAADREIVLAAATLHDTYDDKLVASVPAAKARTREALQAAGATPVQCTAVIAIIDHMSFKANLATHQVLSLEGQLVQDADRLDALGAIGIGRAFMYGGVHGSPMYDPAIPPRAGLTAADYRRDTTILNHFAEKLLHLADTMNTPAAKHLAAGRTQVMQAFVAEFEAEWRGEK